MSTWRAKVSEFFQKWRYARYRAKAAHADLQGELDVEELERARKGVTTLKGAA